MNPNLKKRIESINKGIIPEGYKKTKVGIVPVEWEVDHIGKHLQEYREISNDIEKYPVYSSSRKGLIPQSDYYDQKEATQTNLGYKIVPVGYVTYRHMSDDDIFHFNLNTTGQSVLVSSEYPVFNAKSNANLYYIISCLNEMSRFRYFCRSQKLGGTRTRLYYKNLSMYQLSFPPLPEQQKIAEILSAQDKLIELQEKKIEQLKELKKAYLQKMFPKKGSKYPELRFKGFTDPWEQCKAKELCNIGTGKSNTQDQVKDGIYPFYIRSDIPVKSNKYLYDCEAVITIGDGNIGRVFHYVNGKFDLHQRCYKMTDFQDIWGKYFYYFFSTRFYDRAMKMTAKATVDSVRLEMISEMDIWKPTAIDEQKKIAEFFDNLDNLITLHQRKSEQEKQKKKALMQLLLTGKVRCI